MVLVFQRFLKILLYLCFPFCLLMWMCRYVNVSMSKKLHLSFLACFAFFKLVVVTVSRPCSFFSLSVRIWHFSLLIYFSIPFHISKPLKTEADLVINPVLDTVVQIGNNNHDETKIFIVYLSCQISF